MYTVYIIYCSTSVGKSRRTEDSEGRMRATRYVRTRNNIITIGTQNCEKAAVLRDHCGKEVEN
jgi:hypothetical protein